MLTKSVSQFFTKKTSKDIAFLTYASQRNFAGGGAKKPNIPATETNFDIVVVGNSIANINKCHSSC
jgi:hypothetical protein